MNKIISIITIVALVLSIVSLFISSKAHIVIIRNNIQEKISDLKNNSKSNNEKVYSADELEELIKSRSHSSWNKAAQADNITKTQLKTIAINCAKISNGATGATNLATSICNNPNADEEILNELLSSKYYSVMNVVAKSNKCTSKILSKIAKTCGKIENSDEWAKKLAISICNSPAATADIINELSNSIYYEVLHTAIKSDACGYTTLENLAKECADISNSDKWSTTLATAICDNKLADSNIAIILTDSIYYPVQEIVVTSKLCDKNVLYHVAKACSEFNNSDEWAAKIANYVCNHELCDTLIVNELTNSIYYPVLEIVATSKHCDYSTLLRVAQECADIDNSDEWAKKLAYYVFNHELTDDTILSKLADSPYYIILNDIASCEKSGLDTLTKLAERCEDFSDATWAKTIADSIKNNPKTTQKILDILN